MLKKRLDKFIQSKIAKPAAVIVFSLLLLYLVIPLDLDRFENYSTLVLDKDKQILRAFLNDQDQWCLPPQADHIPEKLRTAVLIYEDRSFIYHPGVNFWSLLRAAYLNLKHKRIISGGSTITMQVARLSSGHKRTIKNKLLEIFQAFKLEIQFSKQKILSLYLDHAPYGGNIIGIRAASLKYFGREPENLTWSESATLAVLPNSPGLISPGKQQQKLVSKRNKLLDKLLQKDIIDNSTCELSKLEPVPDKVFPLPMLAPHLSRKAKQDFDDPVIHTTLKKKIQQDAESILTQQTEYLNSIGVQNASVIIADTKTGEIAAYCGSNNFWDFRSNGQVDGVIAPRSSGSTLKPFLYALSIDDGILLPETRINDVPTYFGAFAPENADKNYDGLVTAHEALVRSLNIPAVRLLYTYGLVEFYESLKAAGISTLFRRSDDYGLTLIIGGSEVTLFDLAGLYRGLGSGGDFNGLYWNMENSVSSSNQLVSAGACYLVLDILQDVIRPGAEYYWHQFEDQWPLAWKTGTSYGNRDAWAIGLNPQWTIGVWVGNFTGESNPALSGAASAGPILFDIFSSLPKSEDKYWFEQPLDMTLVTLCTKSGYLAGENCTETKQVWAPSKTKPLKFCPYHKKRFVNKEGTFTVCSNCWQEGSYHAVSSLEFPPVVAKYLRKRGQIAPKTLPHNPDCDRNRSEKEIEIVYPSDGSVIYIPKDFGGVKQKLTIQIAKQNVETRVFWYLNSIYLRTSDMENEISLDIGRGAHKLLIIDEYGNEAKVKFKVISK